MTKTPPETDPGDGRRTSKSALTAALFGVAVVFVAARFVALDADPFDLVYRHVLSDEGWYSLNARNRTLFGGWALDDHNIALVLCPLHTLVLWWCYELFGVSFLTTRLPGAAASALAVVLVMWRLRRTPRASALTGAVLATQPALFAYARVAFVESLAYGLATLGWVLASSARRSRVVLAASGAAACLAVLAKPTTVFAVPMVLLAVFVDVRSRGWAKCTRQAGWVVAGGLGCLAAFAPFLLDHREFLGSTVQMNATWVAAAAENVARGVGGVALIGFHPDQALGAIPTPAYYPGLLPVLTVFGIAVFGLLLRGRDAGTGPGAPSEHLAARVAWLWIACEFVLLRLLGPGQFIPRYSINLLVPIAVVIGTSWGTAPTRDLGSVRPLRMAAAYLALGLGPLLALREPVLVLLRETVASPSGAAFRGGFVIILLAAAALWCAAAWRLGLARRLLEAARGRRFERVFGTSLVLLLVLSVWVVSADMATPSFSLRDASRSLTTDGAEKVLVGGSANTLALETPYYAFVYRDLRELGQGEMNGDLERLRPTHLVRTSGVELFGEPLPFHPYFASRRLERTLPLCPDFLGGPRFVIEIYVRDE